MNRWRTASLAALAALASGAALAPACTHPAGSARIEHLRAPAAGASRTLPGPRTLSQPAGSAVAQDAAELERMLRDPRGPSRIWLRARSYAGDFAITRPLSLSGAKGATLQGTGRGTVLQIAADGVTVDNLIVRGSGGRFTAEDAAIKAKGEAIRVRHVRVDDALFGIELGPCPRCAIEASHVRGPGAAVALKGDGIKLWESNDAVVRDCLVEGVRDVVVWYSRRVVLDGNTVRNSRYGTHFMYAHDSIVRNSRVQDDVVGIFVMYSARLHVVHNVLAGARGAAGVGLGFKESDAVEIRDNWLVANTTGTYLDETPRSAGQDVVFHGNTFALNQAALRFHGVGEGLRFDGNDFEHNLLLADVEGGGDARAVAFAGNRYSDYAGYDLDRDGVGDVAYQVKRLSNDLMDAHPALSFFRGTAGMALVDAIANAMPVFASRVLLEDREPLLASRSEP